jgi:hypothetical protein
MELKFDIDNWHGPTPKQLLEEYCHEQDPYMRIVYRKLNDWEGPGYRAMARIGWSSGEKQGA